MAVTIDKRGVTNGSNNQRWAYTSDVTVEQGTPAEVEITIPNGYGYITEFAFESLSTDCDVDISEITGSASTDLETVVAFEAINLGYRPSITPSSYNTKATGTKSLFVNVVNNDAGNATGSWKLMLTFGR
jgi:hypothetical protein